MLSLISNSSRAKEISPYEGVVPPSGIPAHNSTLYAPPFCASMQLFTEFAQTQVLFTKHTILKQQKTFILFLRNRKILNGYSLQVLKDVMAGMYHPARGRYSLRALAICLQKVSPWRFRLRILK